MKEKLSLNRGQVRVTIDDKPRWRTDFTYTSCMNAWFDHGAYNNIGKELTDKEKVEAYEFIIRCMENHKNKIKKNLLITQLAGLDDDT